MVLPSPRPQGQVADQVRALGSEVKCHPGLPPERDTINGESEQSPQDSGGTSETGTSSNRIQVCCWNLKPHIDEPPKRNLRGSLTAQSLWKHLTIRPNQSTGSTLDQGSPAEGTLGPNTFCNVQTAVGVTVAAAAGATTVPATIAAGATLTAAVQAPT